MVKDWEVRGRSMSLARLKVIEVVSRGDLHCSGPELAIDQNRIADNRDGATGQRQDALVCRSIVVTGILRVDGHGGVAEHRFRSGRRDGKSNGWILLERVFD